MRGRVGLAVVTALLVVAPVPVAVAADGDPPSELWREFPLDPTTAQTPPDVPPAAGENEAVPYSGAGSQGQSVPPSTADDGGGGVSPIVIAGIAVVLLAGGGLAVARRAGGRDRLAPMPSATVVSTPPAPRVAAAPVPFDTERFTRDIAARPAPPAAPSRSVVALDPARVARRGVPVHREEEVVARIAPATPEVPAPVLAPAAVHEVTWRHGGGQAAFELVPIEDGATVPGTPLRSPASAWRVPGPPPRVPTLRAAHEELCARALAEGWEQVGRGRAWYAHRFRAPVGARRVRT